MLWSKDCPAGRCMFHHIHPQMKVAGGRERRTDGEEEATINQNCMVRSLFPAIKSLYKAGNPAVPGFSPLMAASSASVFFLTLFLATPSLDLHVLPFFLHCSITGPSVLLTRSIKEQGLHSTWYRWGSAHHGHLHYKSQYLALEYMQLQTNPL